MTALRRLVAGIFVALPQAALAGALGGGDHGGAGVAISAWRVIGALMLCLALGTAAIFLLRKRYGLGAAGPLRAAASRRIRIIEQQGLGPQRSLALVEIDRRTYAALIAPGAASLVALSDEPDRPEA
jgi:hypothetical protein